MTASGVKLTVEPSKGGPSSVLEAEVVLVSTGRRPFTKVREAVNMWGAGGVDNLGVRVVVYKRYECLK